MACLSPGLMLIGCRHVYECWTRHGVVAPEGFSISRSSHSNSKEFFHLLKNMNIPRAMKPIPVPKKKAALNRLRGLFKLVLPKNTRATPTTTRKKACHTGDRLCTIVSKSLPLRTRWSLQFHYISFQLCLPRQYHGHSIRCAMHNDGCNQRLGFFCSPPVLSLCRPISHRPAHPYLCRFP